MTDSMTWKLARAGAVWGLLCFLSVGFLPAPASAQSARMTDSASFSQIFTHHTATVNGVKLHYVMGGQGDAVVLLHGFPETWYAWRKVMPALAQKYTVIAVDYRGAGDSAKPAGGYDKRTMAEDIYQLVRHLGFTRAHLVGHDIGGMVAYAYAAAHPDATHTLTILDVPLAGTTIYTQISPHVWWFAFHAEPDVPEALTVGKERDYLTWFYENQTENPAAIDKDAVDEYVRCYAQPGAMRAAFETYRAFPADILDNTASMKSKLTMPVLAIGGDGSAGPFIVAMMREMATHVQGGAIPGSGHFVAEEQPDVLTQRLLDFFAGQP